PAPPSASAPGRRPSASSPSCSSAARSSNRCSSPVGREGGDQESSSPRELIPWTGRSTPSPPRPPRCRPTSPTARWGPPPCKGGGGARKLEFERIYPLDAAFDSLADAPAEVRDNKRYRDVGDFSVQGVAARLRQDFGDRPLDIVVHSLANAPEVKQPLLDTSR